MPNVISPIDNQVPAMEAVRAQYLAEFERLASTAAHLYHDQAIDFWHELHTSIKQMTDPKKREMLERVESRLVSLPEMIETWRSSILKTPEHFATYLTTQHNLANQHGLDEVTGTLYSEQLEQSVRSVETVLRMVEIWQRMPIQQVLSAPEFLAIAEAGSQVGGDTVPEKSNNV